MRITVELSVRDDAALGDIQAFLDFARRIDAGPIVSDRYEVNGMSRTVTGPADQVAKTFEHSPPDDKAVHTTSHGEGPEAGVDEGEDDTADEPQPAGNLPPGVAPPASGSKRGPRAGGRKKAQTAEQQVEALAPTVPNGNLPPPGTADAATMQTPPGVASLPSMQLPPGVTQTAAPPAQPQQSEPAAAMPAASAPSSDDGSGMKLEDFKAEAMTLYTAAQQAGLPAAYPFNIIRAEAWPDGTPKDFRTMVMDQVPLAARRKVLDQCIAILSR